MQRKRRKQKIEKKEYKFNISATSVLIGLSIFIFISTQLIYLSMFGTRGSDITHVKKEKDETVEEIRILDNEISELSSYMHVTKEAEDKLGLVKTSDVHIIPWGDETVGSSLGSDE